MIVGWPVHQLAQPPTMIGPLHTMRQSGPTTSGMPSSNMPCGTRVFERRGGRATGQGLPGRRYFSVPRPLLQGIVATTGATPAVFPRGSSINVAAQLTSLTNSAPALAPGSQLGARGVSCSRSRSFHAHGSKRNMHRVLRRRCSCARIAT